jgi:translation initiation factor 5B
MHGLEPQTIESIELLKARGTPFVVALNKIDRSFEWKVEKDRSSYIALKEQGPNTLDDYKNRLSQVITQMNQKGFNVCMYW